MSDLFHLQRDKEREGDSPRTWQREKGVFQRARGRKATGDSGNERCDPPPTPTHRKWLREEKKRRRRFHSKKRVRGEGKRR